MAKLRPARPEDLVGIYDVWYRTEIDGEPDPPAPGEPTLSEHDLATGDVLVATEDDRLVGFAVVLERGQVAYLADLFVDPDHQSSGIGRRLLNEILRDRRGAICTLSSRDPRALPLYVRAGMRPWWPNLWLLGSSGDLGAVDSEGVAVEEVTAGDPDLVAWDAEACGRARPDDHADWMQGGAGTPLWLLRDSQRVGYAYVRSHSPDALWNPEAATLGPIGVRSADDARAAVAAVVEWVSARAPKLRLSVPGPHPALPVLLDAGFRVTDHETFLTTDPGILDPKRYITSGDRL